MSVTDPIANFLTIIRNGQRAKFKYVDAPASHIKREICKIMLKQGFIKRYVVVKDDKQGLIRIWLNYDKNGDPVINILKRESTPGRRKYVSVNDLPRVKNNLGVAIVTTPKGVMTAREAARSKVGGEVLCTIW